MASLHDTCWGPLVPTILCHWPCCASSFVQFGTQGSVFFFSGWSMTDSCLDLWNFRAFERWRIGRNLCQVTLFQTLEYIHMIPKTFDERGFCDWCIYTEDWSLTLPLPPQQGVSNDYTQNAVTFSLQLRILQVRFPSRKGYPGGFCWHFLNPAKINNLIFSPHRISMIRIASSLRQLWVPMILVLTPGEGTQRTPLESWTVLESGRLG